VDSVLIGGAITDYGGIAWWLNQQEQALKRATNDRWATITLSRPHHSDDIVPELSYDPMDEEEKVETRILAANVGHETNDMSIVLLVTYRNVGIFLMGDATDVTEDAILESLYWDGSWLEEAVHSSDNRIILKVGHHGSDTSSSERWIQSIMPELAFVSSDTKGFGRAGTSIPRKEILDRILAEGNIEDHPGWNHHYVDYDSGTQEHELEGPTTQGVFTTLYRLKWRTHSTFKSYGTSWYFTVYDDGDIGVDPACEWPGVLIADPRPPA